MAITLKDISDTIAYVEFFKEITRFEKNEDIFNFIKKKLKWNENLIKSFEIFSEIYPDIIELNQSLDDDDFPQNLYDIIIKIVKDTEMIFFPNKEEINIKEANEEKRNNLINSIEALFVLNNKINVEQKIYENNDKNKKYTIFF